MNKVIITSPMCRPCEALKAEHPDVKTVDMGEVAVLPYVLQFLLNGGQVELSTPLTIVLATGNGEEARRLLEL